jgi:hypothetical protein
MKKIYAVTTAVCFAIGYNFAIAAPVDSGPPAQQQKEVAPSTTHGDYLEAQPDENGATAEGNNANSSDHKTNKKAKKSKTNAKPANTEKGKSHTEQPESGGVDVQQK